MLLNLVTPLHEATQRDYRARLLDDKVPCMVEARKFERSYWDGERRFGYGGYAYQPGRFRSLAQELIRIYNLQDGDAVLDIGCGKGFLLYELQLLMPGLLLFGMDRSRYAIKNAHPKLQGSLMVRDVRDPLPFSDKAFDLVMSLGTLHNLTLRELWVTLPEIQRIAEHGYIMVESFRNEQEWFNLTAWCLTAESLMRPEDWEFLFEQTGYRGDHEFIFFR